MSNSNHTFQDSHTSSKKKWGRVETLGTVTEAAYDVSFAPSIGRSFHLLAVASKQLHVFALKPLSLKSPAATDSAASLLAQPKLEITHLAKLDPMNSQVWQVSWNVTGTILASTGSDGAVKLWQGNHENVWNCVGEMKPGENRLDQSPKGDGGRYY